MAEQKFVSLATLADGALGELFDAELQRVLQNVADPNTDPEQIRTITLTVKVKPNEEREIGDVTVSAASKLAALKKVKTVIYMGRQAGKLVAVESNPKQQGLFSDKPNMVPISGGKE